MRGEVLAGQGLKVCIFMQRKLLRQKAKRVSLSRPEKNIKSWNSID